MIRLRAAYLNCAVLFAVCLGVSTVTSAQVHHPVLHKMHIGSRNTSQPVPPPSGPGFFGPNIGGVWTSIGPSPLTESNDFGVASGMSGRVVDAAGSPTDANTIYVASAGGGVWKTTNGGALWTPLTDAEPDLAMGAIAVAPSNASVIYAGTGEANNAGDSRYGLGILVSTDAGATWTLETGPSNAFVGLTTSRIAVDPADAKTVYAAMADFGANGKFGTTGIYKSTDGGATWANTTAAVSTTDPFSDVVINPTTPSTLYCAVGNVGGSASNGVYESTDAGTTWSLLSGHPNGAAAANVGWIHLAIAQSSPSTLYSTVENINTNGVFGVFKSTDGGTTWVKLASAPDTASPQAWYDMPIACSPTNADVVFLAGAGDFSGENVAETTDGGTTWNNVQADASNNGPHTDEHSLTFDASGRLLNGCDGGIWRLDNLSPSSLKWESINGNLGTIQFTGGAMHPVNPLVAIAGSQDNGTEMFTNNITWPIIDGGDGGFCKIDQANPLVMYHTYAGTNLAKSTDGGTTWNDATPPTSEGSDFYPHFTMDPSNSARLLYPTTGVWETTDSTTSWKEIGTAGSGGFNNLGTNVNCIGVSGTTVYAAAGGTIYVTTNDGATWTATTVPGFSDHFEGISVNPLDAKEAYIVRDLFAGASGVGHVFFTSDAGGTWTDVTGNLPDEPTNAVVVNWVNGQVWVGTDQGVYTATVQGQWSLFGTGLPAGVAVSDLAFNTTENILEAYTHGRSAWEVALGAATPWIRALLPANVPAGSGPVTLTITGRELGQDTQAFFESTALSTTWVSSAEVMAIVPNSLLLRPGHFHITAQTGGKTAAPRTLTVTNGTPVLVGSLPHFVAAGSQQFTLHVFGSLFVKGAVVSFTERQVTTQLVTTFISPTHLTAVVPAPLVGSVARVTLTVTNPTPGGGTSNGWPFEVK
ncbi:MAG: IPT/TIG domain-containing protein [Armatimonadetes bacterium]|nr:IPT/TIG domain-containing protein [Armatimonadota bacterium]MDE2206468.1 IPT/TIG domain-containing protein [Armatimonadota bacterium]